jgi:hypothetical protein
MNSKTKRGRGRPKGAKSFVNIQMAQLRAVIPDGAVVPVSRVWIENLGLPVQLTDSMTKGPAPAIAEHPSPASKEVSPLEFSVE